MPEKWLVTMVKGEDIKKVVVNAECHAESSEKAIKENPGYAVIVSQYYEKD